MEVTGKSVIDTHKPDWCAIAFIWAYPERTVWCWSSFAAFGLELRASARKEAGRALIVTAYRKPREDPLVLILSAPVLANRRAHWRAHRTAELLCRDDQLLSHVDGVRVAQIVRLDDGFNCSVEARGYRGQVVVRSYDV